MAKYILVEVTDRATEQAWLRVDRPIYEGYENWVCPLDNDILAVFNSRVYYKSEQNVFRYYFFVDAQTEEEFDEYVNNAKKASIYKNDIEAEYGDQLLTLSTCDYSQEDGRFVVVARKIND